MGTQPGPDSVTGAEILIVEDDPGSGATLVDILPSDVPFRRKLPLCYQGRPHLPVSI